MSTADVIAARDRQDENVASPDGPRASRPKRRAFTREYKMRMLGQYENASTPQEWNALLRREGIYSAYMTEWRRERDRAASAPALEKKPGRPGPGAKEGTQSGRISSVRNAETPLWSAGRQPGGRPISRGAEYQAGKDDRKAN